MGKTVGELLDDLLEHIEKSLTRDGDRIDRESLRKFKRKYDALDSRLMEGRESYIVTPTEYNMLLEYKEVLEGLFKPKTDEELLDHYLDKIDKVDLIKRAEKWDILFIRSRPSPQVALYLGEASRCYIYGFFLACIALCRAVIDFALEEISGKKKIKIWETKPEKKGLQAIQPVPLNNLIKIARDENVLDRKLARDAHKIKKLGNDCLHEGLTNPSYEGDAFNSLTKTKDILAHLYNG